MCLIEKGLSHPLQHHTQIASAVPWGCENKSKLTQAAQGFLFPVKMRVSASLEETFILPLLCLKYHSLNLGLSLYSDDPDCLLEECISHRLHSTVRHFTKMPEIRWVQTKYRSLMHWNEDYECIQLSRKHSSLNPYTFQWTGFWKEKIRSWLLITVFLLQVSEEPS